MATIEVSGQRYSFDESSPIDISIPLRFDGPQPNAFGVPVATAKALGDTRAGSSVNFEQYSFTPHCNGTHTECVGHITNDRVSVRECLRDVFVPAVLVSVESEISGDDLVITRSILERALTHVRGSRATDPRVRNAADTTALIVRALPNDDSKLTRVYDEENIPPYFSADAMEFIVACGFKHVLVDLPSIDRLFDGGKLENHRIFWNVEPGSFETNAETRINSTITELIYVPNEVEDGEYLLNLQIAPFDADAAPSRPVIFSR